MMPYFNRASSQGQDLSAEDELDKVLEENKDAEGREQKD
jgi:hypothetical protein